MPAPQMWRPDLRARVSSRFQRAWLKNRWNEQKCLNSVSWADWMTRVRERRPEQRIQAQVKAQKEAKLGRVKQGWKASRSGAKERTKRSGMRQRPCLSSLRNERQRTQKKDLTTAGAC